MLTNVKPLLDWLHHNPHWAGVFTFVISFLESFAVVGLLVPGAVMMTALGILIGSGVVPFTSITLWAIAGAIVGDVLSFWIGHHFQGGIRNFWPFRSHPGLLRKGEMFFVHHGGKGIFLGRFVGPVRPLLPLIAGMMSMSVGRFLVSDVLSSIVWAPVYMLPGIVMGYASQELAPEMTGRLLLMVVLVLLVFWCISWLIKRIYLSVVGMAQRKLARLWLHIHNRPALNFFKRLLLDPMQAESHSQLTLGLLFFFSGLLFIVLTYSVIHHGIFTIGNAPVYYFMRSLRMTAFDPIMIAITALGPPILIPMWAVVLIWLVVRRYYWEAYHWGGLGLLVIISGAIIKIGIHFPRPPGLLQTPSGWSYPSGHTLFALTLFGFLALLLARNRQPNIRWLIYSVAGVITFCSLFSRLYLGAHWLSDIIGGFLLGVCLLTLVIISYRRRATTAVAPLGILLSALLALIISLGWYFAHNFKQDIHDYTPAWPIQMINSQQWWQQAAEISPLYRYNRFGQPIEVLNVQWAGTLPNIEQTLIKQNWNLLPRASLLLVLGQLTSKHHHNQLPILSQFYEDRKPVLVMYKIITTPKAVAILRLWDARIRLSNGTPLWLGTVVYHKSWHTHFLRHASKLDLLAPGLPGASDVLRGDLNGWTWRRVHYLPSSLTPGSSGLDWDGTVLVIKPITP